MKRKYDSGVCFLCLCYPDNPTRISFIGTTLLLHEEIVWTNHYSECGIKDHTHAIVRTENAQTISAFSKNHNIPEQFVQLCGRDREHKNARGAMIYIVHQDEESILEEKKQYDESAYKGPWAPYAKQVLRKYLSTRQRSDSDITLILDYLDRQEYISINALVRWCVAHNLYSVYRRSASTISNCVREHNAVYSDSDMSGMLLHRVKALESNLQSAEKEIQYLKGVNKYRDQSAGRAKVDISIIKEYLQQKGFYD